MRRTFYPQEITALHWKVERELLIAEGFHPDYNILRIEHRDPDDGHLDYVEFEQDDTPNISGDNIQCEYLTALGS